MSDGMRIVVTGATGNLGTAALDALAREPRVGSLVGLARRAPAPGRGETEFVRADVERDDLARLFRGADVVVHLAWLFQPTHRPERTWRANVLGALRVFDAVAAAGGAEPGCAASGGGYSPPGGGGPGGSGGAEAGVRVLGGGLLAAGRRRPGRRGLAHPRLARRRLHPGKGLRRAVSRRLRTPAPRDRRGPRPARVRVPARGGVGATAVVRRSVRAGQPGPAGARPGAARPAGPADAGRARGRRRRRARAVRV